MSREILRGKLVGDTCQVMRPGCRSGHPKFLILHILPGGREAFSLACQNCYELLAADDKVVDVVDVSDALSVDD